jgi:rRNA maturation endonuclease Nob1
MNNYLKMPWSTETTIKNLKDVGQFIATQLKEINADGMREKDAAEFTYDFDRAIVALEKQVAKKIIDNTGTDERVEVWYQCPVCKGDLTKIRSKYCPYCGQAIGWESDTTPDAETPEWKDRMMKTFLGR